MSFDASRLAAETLRLLPRKRLSRAIGRIADVRGPRAVVDRAIDAFVRVYGVDLSEAEVPRGGFRTFDEFFTRRLREGARPLDPDPRVIVSPADGRVEDAGPIAPDSTFLVKGRVYELAELVGDPHDAARLAGGSFAIVYLAPRDYHRVHSPVAGRVTHTRYVAGTLYPVNTIGMTHVPRLFARNERVAIAMETEDFGFVTTTLVGAIGVGRISLSFDDVVTNVGREGGVRRYGKVAPDVERGEELGAFHLGSTVIVFAGPNVPLACVPPTSSSLRMGTALLRKVGG